MGDEANQVEESENMKEECEESNHLVIYNLSIYGGFYRGLLLKFHVF